MLTCMTHHGIKFKTNPFHGLDKIGELVELIHGGNIQGQSIVVAD